MVNRDSTPTVFLVDDDDDLRATLAMAIKSVKLAVAEYASSVDFLAEYDPARPGCLVLDVRMPGLSGPDLQAELVKRDASLPIIFLSGHGSLPIAVKAVQTGAVDYIEKRTLDIQDLLDRIQRALKTDARNRAERQSRRIILDRIASLTPREKEVLDLVVTGHASKVIALDLNISERTVENHRASIMKRMGAASVVDLVRMVLSVSQ